MAVHDFEDTTGSALDLVETSFLTLTESPGGLGVNGADFPGLADRWFGLRDLRVEMTRPQASWATRNAVWAFLLAARDVDAWKVAAVGMAMPALRHITATLAPVYRGEAADLDAEVLTGFIDVYAGLPAGTRGIPGRLAFGAYEAGLVEVAGYRKPGMDLPVLGALPRPWLEPRWLLAQAVERAVISPPDARLLALTRLQGVTVAAVSERSGVPGEELAIRRDAAELELAVAVGAGELGPGTGGGR